MVLGNETFFQVESQFCKILYWYYILHSSKNMDTLPRNNKKLW